MGAAYTAIKFEGPGHPTWQLAVYNNILVETIFLNSLEAFLIDLQRNRPRAETRFYDSKRYQILVECSYQVIFSNETAFDDKPDKTES